MTAHWGLPDPAAVTGDEGLQRAAFAQAYRVLERRLESFCKLHLESLDMPILKTRLNDIGKLGAHAATCGG